MKFKKRYVLGVGTPDFLSAAKTLSLWNKKRKRYVLLSTPCELLIGSPPKYRLILERVK